MPIDRKGTTTSPLSIPIDEPTTARLVVCRPWSPQRADSIFDCRANLFWNICKVWAGERGHGVRIESIAHGRRYGSSGAGSQKQALAMPNNDTKPNPNKPRKTHRNPAYPCSFHVV